MDEPQKPYSDDDVRMAIAVIERRMIKQDLRDPELFMQFMPIRASLKELLTLRAKNRLVGLRSHLPK